MALIKCKECNNEISDKAKSCPQCGVPVPPPKNSIKRQILNLIVIIVIVLLTIQYMEDNTTNNNLNNIPTTNNIPIETNKPNPIKEIKTTKEIQMNSKSLDNPNIDLGEIMGKSYTTEYAQSLIAKYGTPETLDGTNNTIWIAYFPKGNFTIVLMKSLNSIDLVKFGKLTGKQWSKEVTIFKQLYSN